MTYLMDEIKTKKKISQREQAPGTVKNAAGGYSFKVDDWVRLQRFLVLGSEGGTFYISQQKLTKENTETVRKCLAADYKRTIDLIVKISSEGRAVKNDVALFALAIAASYNDKKDQKYSRQVRSYALSQLPLVARIGTHLFLFNKFVIEMRGTGRGWKEANARWYESKSDEDLVYQLMKYQNREGWTHRDLLRLAHVNPANLHRSMIYNWVINGGKGLEEFPTYEDATKQVYVMERRSKGEVIQTRVRLPENEAFARIWAFERIKTAGLKEAVKLITDYDLPREVVPTHLLNEVEVWAALLERMPLTAMIRNLGKMTSVGLLKPMSKAANHVVTELTNEARLIKARVHPLQILVAFNTYAQGHGEKGSNTWTPVQTILDALDKAFYLAFKAVEPSNERIMLAVDASGSMNSPYISGMVGITPRIGSAVMALVTAATEPNHAIYRFTTSIGALDISPRMRLDQVMTTMRKHEVPQGTDCALPMQYALKNRIEVDSFVLLTDSETWAGSNHPHLALKEYRKKMGIPAKLVAVGMVANRSSIADPNDAGSMEVVGFDTNAPRLVSDFIAGKI